MNQDRITKLKEFLEKDPTDSFARYALALEYAGRGEIQIAVACLQEVLNHDPGYIPAYHQLGINYAKLGKSIDAGDILKKGISVATEQGDLHARSEMQEALDELS